jgi:hypothetical protein
MYKTNQYKKLTLDVMEVVGSYIISLYYNNMYTTAKMKHEQQHYASVTDAYKDVIKGFLMNIDQPEQLNTFLYDLKKWYGAWINNQNVNHALITDSIVREYIPEDYFAQLSYTDKDKLFVFIFIQAIKRIGMQIYDINNLRKICDDHDNKKANVLYFQDVMLTIMIEIRTVLYSKFMNGSVNNGVSDNRDILIEQLKTDLIKITHENYQMKINENKYKAIVQHNVKQKENLQSTIDELQITNNKLNQAIQSMRRSTLHRRPPREFPNPALGTPRPSMYESQPTQPMEEKEDDDDFLTSSKSEAFDLGDNNYVNPEDLDLNDPDFDNINDFEKMELESRAIAEGLNDNDGNSEFSRDLKRDFKEIKEQERMMDEPMQVAPVQLYTPPINTSNPINKFPQKATGGYIDDNFDTAAAEAKERRQKKRMEYDAAKTQQTDEETVLRGDYN